MNNLENTQPDCLDELHESYGSYESEREFDVNGLLTDLHNISTAIRGFDADHESDLDNLMAYLTEMDALETTSETSLMFIRKDDFVDLVSLASEYLRKEQETWEHYRELEETVKELEANDPLERHMKSISWNTNRIASVLEAKDCNPKLSKLLLTGRKEAV